MKSNRNGTFLDGAPSLWPQKHILTSRRIVWISVVFRHEPVRTASPGQPSYYDRFLDKAAFQTRRVPSLEDFLSRMSLKTSLWVHLPTDTFEI